MIIRKKHHSYCSIFRNKAIVLGISFSMICLINSGIVVKASIEESTRVEQNTDANLIVPKDALFSGNYGEKGITDPQWYISNDKVLHLWSGNIAENNGSKTSPWAKYSDDITKVSFDRKVVLPRHIEYLFANLKNVTEFEHLDNLSLPEVSYWTGTFSGDPALKEMNFPVWDGSITRCFLDFSHMFENDTSLTSVDISGWDVDNVMTMESMFANDTALENVGVKFFEQAPYEDIASLANVKNMFLNDSALKTLDISNWKMYTKGKLMDTSTMFKGTNLQSIRLSNLNQFTANTVLPAKNTNRWVNIGNRTSQDPQKDKVFSTASISDYYDGSNIIEYPLSDLEKDKFAIDTFIPDPHRSGDLIIKSNLADQTIHNVNGNIGDTIKVEVPVVKGYTADKKNVSAIINVDGSITTTEKVFYKKNEEHHFSTGNSHHFSTSNSHESPDIKLIKRNSTVMTYSDKPIVRLYSWDSKTTMKLITNRALQKNSGWFSDEMLSINGEHYYRVSTNEWVKSENVYVYQSHSVNIKTNKGNFKKLFKAEGFLITNRALAPQSQWYSDLIVNIKGQKYYRVGTNEFVKTNDIEEY